MIHSYQQEREMEIAVPAAAEIARVGHVYPEGVTLIFADGVESRKRYQVNLSADIQPGQRVRVIKLSGTYVVEYPIGRPGERKKAGEETRKEGRNEN